MIEFYNKTKGGTDCYDFKCHQYTTARKTSRWPVRSFYGILDQAGVNSFILYNLNQFNAPLKPLDYLRELALQLVKPTLIKRLATPTLRIGLRNTIEEFLDSRELPEEMDIRDEFVDNRLPKQKRCNLCPSSLDRKTYYKCLRCHKAICKEHVAKLCCECSNTM
ncbi:GSCOCG00013217001-RA-CDS [Cotesia congregata]|nr:GSCOCG00013217001-RA-CDS [Cotesia congregata]